MAEDHAFAVNHARLARTIEAQDVVAALDKSRDAEEVVLFECPVEATTNDNRRSPYAGSASLGGRRPSSEAWRIGSR